MAASSQQAGAGILPRHEAVYSDIQSKIASGVIRDREQIPPLLELCTYYGVSTSSVRRALNDLERDGLISKSRGRGTFAIAQAERPVPVRRGINALLIGEEFNLYRSPMQSIHEVFDLLAGVRDAARETGNEMTLISQVTPQTLPQFGPGDGCIVVANSWNEELQTVRALEEQGIPHVLINAPVSAAPCVRVDFEQAAFLGVDHLAKIGHRRIGYIGFTRGVWFEPRLKGYLRALEENGLPFDPDLVQPAFVEAQEAAAFDRLLTLPDPITALFTETDFRALRLMEHARKRGIAVPERLSVCGYDDVGEATRSQPALTTVHHPSVAIGRESVKLLLQLIDARPPVSLDVVLPAQLIVRASTTSPGTAAHVFPL